MDAFASLDQESIRQLDEVSPGDYVEVVYGTNGCLTKHGRFVEITSPSYIFPRRVKIECDHEQGFKHGCCIAPSYMTQFRILQKSGDA